MVNCTRIIQFDAAHRLVGHEGKCKYVHGHRYIVEISVVGDIDDIGRIIDFSCIKDVVGGWINENWDHGIILNQKDSLLGGSLSKIVPGQKVYYVPFNPTAEALAEYIAGIADTLLNDLGVMVSKVILRETENCYATYESEYFDARKKVPN